MTEQELIEKFRNHSHRFDQNDSFDGGYFHAKECVRIAKEYAKGLLDEQNKLASEAHAQVMDNLKNPF